MDEEYTKTFIKIADMIAIDIHHVHRGQKRQQQRQRRLLTTLIAVLVVLSVIFPTTTCQEVVAAADGGAIDDNNDYPNQRIFHENDNEKRLWGASSSSSSFSTSSSSEEDAATVVDADAGDGQSNNERPPVSTIPFLKPKVDSSKDFFDPFAQGFQITARVYTDPQDKLAHFEMYDTIVTDSGNKINKDDDDFVAPTIPIVFPYWECGLAGSTTVPIPLQHVTVRHLLGGSIPSNFATEGDFGPYPQLVVPLTQVQVVLNSGQSRTFGPGQVVLLENVITGGHKLQGHEHRDMTVLLLTLPHVYHQVGRDHNALQSIFEKSFWKQNPCKTGVMSNTANGGNGQQKQGHNFGSYFPRRSSSSDPTVRSNSLARWVGPPRTMRRISLGAIGFTLSVVVADFLGKCAPLSLALAFGGGAILLGGTIGMVKVGEYALDELDIWHEKRLLRLNASPAGRSSGSTTGQQTSLSSTGEEATKRRIPEESGGSDHANTPPLRAFSSAQEYKQPPRAGAAAEALAEEL